MNKMTAFVKRFFILIFYRNDTELLTYPGKKDRDFFILQAVLGTVVVNLMFTVFLSGIFIYFDTPDGIMGYIPILPSVAGILLIFTGTITEKIRNVKRTVIILNICSKSFLLTIVWIPLFIKGPALAYAMLAAAFIGFLLNAIMSVLINNWFVEAVDEKIRGRYMSVRQIFTLLVSATIPIISGRFLDMSPDKYVAFCIIFSIGWIFAGFESFSLSKIKAPAKEEHEYIKYKVADLFLKPLKNKAFMRFIWVMIIFSIVWNFSMAFASVYQIKYMEISYTYMNIMASIGAIAQILIYPLAGKIMDKYGSKLLMRIAFFFFMTHAFLYIFMGKGNAYLILFLLNINGSIVNPAWILATFNERFRLIPKQGRTIYDGFFVTVIGISTLLGPVLGNIIRKILLGANISFISFPEFRLLFLMTFVILLVLNTVLYIKGRKESRVNKNYIAFKPLSILKNKRLIRNR